MPPVPARILVVDDSADFRRLIRHHLSAKWADAEVVEHDPVTQGPLAADFDGAGYSLVLLDYQLGADDGLHYLRRFRHVPGFPPVIMLTGEGNERLAVEAIKLGAADYIPKQHLSHAILVRAIEEALDARGAAERFDRQMPSTGVRLGLPQVPGYTLDRVLGQGGMSAVYLARRDADGAPVVIKAVRQASGTEESDMLMSRFFMEYELVSRLQHPSIVRIFEQGTVGDLVFIAMEYFPDGSLLERLRQGITIDAATAYLRGMAEALEVVHAAGIVHRDLKPGNVMFRGDGRIVLIDFGVAKSVDHTLELTQAGTVVGTPHYMSPEQCDGQALDARSDLYSLGVIGYEMVTGSVPYTARTPLAVLYKHKHAPIPVLPEGLGGLAVIIPRLLAKHPRERYQSARELLDALPPG